ncbi:hypothetical protein EVAR_26603_1 [Eumeta japonica]|uniref:Uncharacterized protein n=1 Tax=Eumeta variegata TaxID=151549 RepID=A0A4C1XJJ1_EUMVA|nr:hypothetical protein EVAR_26603_1 [Eumeta japonica]
MQCDNVSEPAKRFQASDRFALLDSNHRIVHGEKLCHVQNSRLRTAGVGSYPRERSNLPKREVSHRNCSSDVVIKSFLYTFPNLEYRFQRAESLKNR